MTLKIKLKVLLSTLMLALQCMSIRKVKMATAILILFKAPERGHSNVVFEKQQCLHNQKLRTVVGQKYHPEWYFLMRPARTIKHLLCVDWRNFRTGVSCFSKTLFYFILLALTHGRVTCC